MKRKKKVTPAVQSANRANAQSSTGPTTKQGKSNSRRNALRHGILSRKVELDTDEQRAEFPELLQSCETEFAPEGLLRNFLVRRLQPYFGSWGSRKALKSRNFCGVKSSQTTWTAFFTKSLYCPLAAMIFRLIEAGTVNG